MEFESYVNEAVRSADLETYKWWTSHKTTDFEEIKNRLLKMACDCSNQEIALDLLARGADPNFLAPLDGLTCLHVAARKLQVDLVKVLLSHGANPHLNRARAQRPWMESVRSRASALMIKNAEMKSFFFLAKTSDFVLFDPDEYEARKRFEVPDFPIYSF